MEIEEAINLAIDNVIKEGFDDIYPSSFEVELLKDVDFRKKIFSSTLPKLKKTNLDEMDFMPLQYSYFPKKEAFDFRKAALIQPWDVIKYLSLVLLCAEEIEANRIPVHSNTVFSYRYNPKNGLLFDQNYIYQTFTKNVKNRIIDNGYKLYIKADIANYYDRLNLHRLENVLLTYCKNKKNVNLLTQLLLFWSNRDSYGLPVGSNASRILAEAELIDVDNYLKSKNIDFIRYVDDYRLFANDAKEAHYYLNLLIDRLSIEGLSVNTGKTSIEKAKEYKSKDDDKIENTDFITEEKDERQITRIIVGYSGLIPTKFRQPSEREAASINRINFDDLKMVLQSEEIIKPESIRDFSKYVVLNNKWEELPLLIKIIDKFPQFTLYISDIFTRNKDKLTDAQKIDIKNKFLEILKSSNSYPEYMYTASVTILTEDEFRSKYDILNFYRDIKRSMGSYIGRYTIERLCKLLARGEILEIRNCFNQVDFWEKRAIIKITKEILEKEECRPWLKNIKSTIKIDPFSYNMCIEKNKSDTENSVVD